MTGRVHRDEQGAVLVMALIFLTVGALLAASLLSFADTNFRTTVNVRSQGEELYAVDAAVEAAINAYRNGGTCPAPLAAAPPVNDVTGVTVSCTAGVLSSGTPSNAPQLAVIARSSGSEDGVVTVSSAVTRVRGGLYSNTSINNSAGSALDVAGPVVARTGCNRSELITSTPAPECNKTDAYAPGEEPTTGFGAAVATAPPLRSVPSCPTSGPVVFQPGSYDDGAGLNALFGSCAGRVFHFPSDGAAVGVYYFDFTDVDGDHHEWTIGNPNTVVVGGTLPAGATLATVATLPQGSRCDANAAGVQFIFGNDSRIEVASGSVELCAQHDPTNTNQEIGLYGVKTGETIPPAPAPQTATYNASTATPSTTGQFAPADDAKAPGGGAATANLVSTADATRTATLTLSGFSAAAVPAGSTISSAVLKVTHRATTTATNLSQLDLSAAVTGGGGATASFQAPSTISRHQSGTTFITDTLTLPAAFRTIAQLTNLSVVYTASTGLNTNTPRSFSEVLDAIVLEVNYTPPSPPPTAYLRAQAGCITVTPYGTSGSCALVSTGGSNANFAVHGTVFAPLAALDIHLVDVSYQVFTRGVIIRHLRSNVTAGSLCATAVVPIPDNCYAFQLPTLLTTTGDVLFVAKVGTRTRLRALVRFSGVSAPQVQSWSVVNEP